MSTQIPPAPKRIRRIGPNAVVAQENLAAPVHTIVCQFRNAQDGTLLGPAVSLPADTGREGLELLVNNLRGSVRRLPFPSSVEQEEQVLTIETSRPRTPFPSPSTSNSPLPPPRPSKVNLPSRKKASDSPSPGRFTPTC